MCWCADGTIAAIGPGRADSPHGMPPSDGAGALLLPGLIEGHTHLDKTALGWPVASQRGRSHAASTASRMSVPGAPQPATMPPRASLALARDFLANGTTRMRTHADIDTDIGLAHLHATMQTRDALADAMEMQIVAFPQSGLTNRPGTEALMDAALREGADIVGGIDPCAIDRDPVRCLDVTFALASRHGRPIDIHLHEPGEMGAFSLDLILRAHRGPRHAGQSGDQPWLLPRRHCRPRPRRAAGAHGTARGGDRHHRAGLQPGATARRPAAPPA